MEPNPQEIAEKKELRVLSWRAVWTMPEHLRIVITHLYICDRTPEEAAIMLGVDSDTLQNLHNKALENLRGRIKPWQ
jgi:DNA-directed RNA polymerase specialized sigma24 family protein